MTSICPHCGAPRVSAIGPCPRCGEDGTALVQSPNALPKPPKKDDAHLPTALIQSPNAVDDAGLPTSLVASPNAAPRPSAPAPHNVKTTLESAPFPVASVPSGAHPTHVVPVSARDEVPALTNRVEAPFPVEKPAPKKVKAAETREAPAAQPEPSDTADDAANDTGRVVAPYRNAKPDDDTGKVAVPFRAVEAPFAVDDLGEPPPPSVPSIPMAVAKKRGSTGTFDESDEGSPLRPVQAPFPLGQTPAAGRPGLKAQPKMQPPSGAANLVRNLLLMAGVALMVATVGIAIAVIMQSGPKAPPKRSAPVTDVSAKWRVRPGWLRVAAMCGAKELPAQLLVGGVEKGITPVEVPVPGTLPPGDYTLDLRLVTRLGATEARYYYSLPPAPGSLGVAVEVEIDGCQPQQFGK